MSRVAVDADLIVSIVGYHGGGQDLEVRLADAPGSDGLVIGRSATGDQCQISLDLWVGIKDEPSVEQAVGLIQALLRASIGGAGLEQLASHPLRCRCSLLVHFTKTMLRVALIRLRLIAVQFADDNRYTSLMEPFENEGIFWLPVKDNVQLAGRLKFDPAEGATLNLMGGFGAIQEQFSDQARMIRMHGVAGKRYLTLDGCFNTDTTHEAPGITRQTYYVNRIITDHLFGDCEALTFDKCSVAFDQLPAWIRRSGVSVSLQTQTPNISTPPDKITIEFNPFQDEIARIGDEALRLSSTWTLGGDNITQTYLNQGTHLELKYPAPQPLASVLDDVKHLQDLLTLATAAPTVPEEITLWREDIVRELPSGEQRPQPMNYYAGQLAERVRLRAPQSAGKVLFQFNDIGGLPTIAQWVKVAREYHTVSGSLLSIRYAAGLYVVC